jgi:DNA polymerase-3 subunit gamma/tau
LAEALPKSKIKLKSDIERYVRPIQWKRQNVRVEIAEGAPVDLIGKMVAALQDLTSVPWLISPEKSGGGTTLAEARRKAKTDQEKKDKSHPAFSHPLLRNAQLLGIQDRRQNNIVQGDFGKGDRQDILDDTYEDGLPQDYDDGYMPPDYDHLDNE